MTQDYQILIKQAIFTPTEFVRATFTGQQRGHETVWKKITIEPVEIKGAYSLQFAYYDELKAVTKNYRVAVAQETLHEVLGMGFKNIYVRQRTSGLQIQITKKGKALVKQHKNLDPETPNLSHDRSKNYAIKTEESDFLKVLEIADPNGKIKPSMQSKYRQINEFLRILEDFGDFKGQALTSLSIIDCGSGNAYLTFAVYHYFNFVLSIPTKVIGVDIDAAAVERNRQRAAQLNWDKIDFIVSNIIAYQPENQPDIVLALHACDTATDEALAQAIKWDAKFIFSVPCCHHELQSQLSNHTAPDVFSLTLKHNILKERMGDILTDSLRATILEMHGYQTDVIQFISSEHTAKNIMIRAKQTSHQSNNQAAYQQLKDFWQITPYLETLLQAQA